MFESIAVPRTVLKEELKAGFPFEYKVDCLDDFKACRDLVMRYHGYLAEAFKKGYPVRDLLKARLEFADRLLADIYGHFNLQGYDYLALIAVGGYGRGELFLASDIDIMIASSKDPIPQGARKDIEKFISFLWDLKLDIGPTVRTIRETVLAARSDLTIVTNLLETHLIAGADGVYKGLIKTIRADGYWTAENFLDAKINEQTIRYHDYRDTVYSTEPDIKNNPGGLRDLSVILWVANLFRAADTPEKLRQLNIITKAELTEFIESRDFLWDIRYALHCVSSGNRLTMELQNQGASLLGYGDEGNKPVENMMRQLFRILRRVRELNNICLQIETLGIKGHVCDNDEPVFLEHGFVRRGHYIDVIDGNMFTAVPQTMIELFTVIAEHPEVTGLHFNCMRALIEGRRALKMPLIFLPECRKNFKAMLNRRQCLNTAFTMMHEARVIASYLPQWDHIEGLTQFDMFHLFSVDEHTVRVMNNLDLLSRSKDQNYALFRTTYRSLSEPVVLHTAAFLHDIGKGRGGHHSEEGAKDALNFCQLHNFSHYQTQLVAWLVLNHLSFSTTAQRRDISDPEVINQFAVKMKDEEHLNLLYCLTVADITATNDREWTSWKENIFRQLYLATKMCLRQGSAGPQDMELQVQENQQVVIENLRQFRKSDIIRYMSRFPAQYFIHYTAAEIAWHARNILHFGQRDEPLILFAQNRQVGTELMILHRNNSPMSFGVLTLAMSAKNLNVFSAQLFLTHDNYVFCTIKFQTKKGQPMDNDRLHSLRRSILDNWDKEPKIEDLPEVTPPIFNVPTEINYPKDQSSKHTSVEITALDTPGLLAKIGIAIGNCGCLIAAARITTTGERADDFFAVTDLNGLPLEEAKLEELSAALRQALEDKSSA